MSAISHWNTIDAALADLNTYSESVVRGSRVLEETHFDVATCIELSREMRNEPPEELFEIGWQNNREFDALYAKLQELTNEGTDVSKQWKAFRTALESIWVQLPRYYKGVRIAAENATQSADTTAENTQEQQNELYNLTELPADFDPLKPFPQYQIPADIDV